MEPQAPPQLPYVNFRDEPFNYGDKTISEAAALQLVNDTFTRFESDRRTNYEGKWLEATALYNGVVQQKNWDNSQIPRSAIPNNIAFDHVEGALAMMESAIFDTGEDWFSVDSMDGSDPRDAKDIRSVFRRDLDIPDAHYGFATARREIRLGMKSTLQFGEGMLMLEWDPRYKRPRVCYTDIRNVYVDPDCKTPNIEDARAIIVRSEMTLQELRQYQDIEGVNVPSDPQLMWAINHRPVASADNTQRMMDNLSGINVSPVSNDYMPMLTQNRVEVLRYYDKERIIWIIDRSMPMLIMKNPYRYYPIVAAPCRPMLNRFWGSSYPGAIRFQQRASEALINGIVDEVSLILNPPSVAPEGAKASEYKTYPGRIAVNKGDAKSIIQQAPPGTTINLIPLIERLVAQADQRNGLNAATIGGNARPGNINRTRAGVDMQNRGTDARTAHVIKNLEDYMLVPLFYKMYLMYQVHVGPDEVIMERYPSRDDNYPSESITGAVFHKPMRFSMEAANRLLTRNQVGQTLPFVMQTLLSGQLMSALASQNKTVNIDGVVDMIEFSTGSPKKFMLFRPMTEQEIKAKDQPPPQAVMQQQAKQQSDMAKMQIAREGNQTKLQVAQIAKQPNPFDAQIKMQESQIKQQEGQQKLAAEAQLLQMKLEAQARENDLKAQQAERETAIKQQQMLQKFRESQMEGAMQMQSHALNMRMQQEQAMMQRAQMAQQAQQQNANQRPTSNSRPTE